MARHKKNKGKGSPVLFIIFGFLCLILLVVTLINGKDVAIFNPKGLIAHEQLRLMLFTVAVLLEICIPTLIIFYYVAWKYRESNDKSAYNPDAKHGKLFVATLWAIPTLVMLILAFVMWPATHRLVPQKTIAASTDTLKIQVIAMRWKWLFIYPEQNVASVNFVQLPTGRPVEFELSADETPMSSFWIPHLGGQLYAMTGHVNRLNLIAAEAGDYQGSTAEINGAGFAGMRFKARAGSTESFDQWVQNVRQSGNNLDTATYQDLLKPSENNLPTFYSNADPDLYAKMLVKYTGGHSHLEGHE